jgi:hypothetical protein
MMYAAFVSSHKNLSSCSSQRTRFNIILATDLTNKFASFTSDYSEYNAFYTVL